MTEIPQEILAGAVRGDQSAFAEIVRAHQAMVFSIARHYLRDREVAEEVAQEVFLELYRNLGSIQSPAHLTFWLRRVASNRSIDLTRRGKLRPQTSLDEAPELASDASQRDSMLARTLGRHVASLPDTARMVLVLRYQEDMDPAEIAEVLDMPVNTVKSHLRRSLMLLRAKLTRCLGGAHV